MHDKVVDAAIALEGMYELPKWKKLGKLEERAAGFADRGVIGMRIARGGPGLSVIQQPTNDWQTLAERQRPHGELWRMLLMRASSPSGLCVAMRKNRFGRPLAASTRRQKLCLPDTKTGANFL